MKSSFIDNAYWRLYHISVGLKLFNQSIKILKLSFPSDGVVHLKFCSASKDRKPSKEWCRCSCAHSLKAFRLNNRTWGREATASRSSVVALILRSWSRRNWMSEAGVSRSWTHNSTANNYLTISLDKFTHIPMSHDRSWSYNWKSNRDLWARLFYLIIFIIFNPLQNKNSPRKMRGEKKTLKWDPSFVQAKTPLKLLQQHLEKWLGFNAAHFRLDCFFI